MAETAEIPALEDRLRLLRSRKAEVETIVGPLPKLVAAVWAPVLLCLFHTYYRPRGTTDLDRQVVDCDVRGMRTR